MPDTYMRFTDLFARLSPYELSHLSEALLCTIEQCFEGKLFGKDHKELTECEIEQALTNAMRNAVVFIQEREIKRQQLCLEQQKANIFLLERVA